MITAAALAADLGITRRNVRDRALFRSLKPHRQWIDGRMHLVFTPEQAAIISEPARRGRQPKGTVKP